jgi:hypothetical protein
LGNDADPKPLRLEKTADHRHTEAGVIHIGIAADDNDVAAIPAQLIHLGTGHRKKGGRTQALSPIFGIGKKRNIWLLHTTGPEAENEGRHYSL